MTITQGFITLFNRWTLASLGVIAVGIILDWSGLNQPSQILLRVGIGSFILLPLVKTIYVSILLIRKSSHRMIGSLQLLVVFSTIVYYVIHLINRNLNS